MVNWHAELRDWLTHEFEVTAPGSVGVRYRSVRAFIRWCFSEGELERNPIAGIPAPSQPDKPRACAHDGGPAQAARGHRCDRLALEAR